MKDLENYVASGRVTQQGDRSSTAAHTPGPWKWVDDPNAGCDPHLISGVKYVIDGCGGYGSDATIQISVADRRLIAAAPTMFDALRVVLAMTEDFLTDPTQHQDYILTALDGVRAAIAAAVGDRPDAATDAPLS